MFSSRNFNSIIPVAGVETVRVCVIFRRECWAYKHNLHLIITFGMNVVVQMVVLEHICTWLMLIFRFIAER